MMRLSPILCVLAVLALVTMGGCRTETLFTNHPSDADGLSAIFDAGLSDYADDPNGTIDNDGDKYTETQGDCNDYNASIHPGATEICNDSVDNNCNGTADLYEPDGDGDGYGPCQGDCNDKDKTISPAAVEVADGKDNNCDGIIDGDYDGDGYTTAKGDCDDKDAYVNPKATENCHDKKDNDCNGYIDDKEPDKDKDGYGPCSGDCDDNDAKVNPKAAEIAGDGKDNNCDNLVDEDIDGDGWTVTNGDCNDKDKNIYPGAKVACNSPTDNNCNKIPDNQEKQDYDGDGVSGCDGDCDDNDAARSPEYAEIQGDGKDNDCDGKVDNVPQCDCAGGVTEAKAIDLCLKGVTITSGGKANSRGVKTGSYGVIKPRRGCGFFTISSGVAWSTNVQNGTKQYTNGNPVSTTGCMKCTVPGGSKWVHPGPSGCCESRTENDPSWVKLTIKVPKNAQGFKFDFIFLSAEYPEWVKSSFNDTFYAVLSSAKLSKTQNISFDIKGQPLTVNNGWFENPSSATQKLSGTGYDKWISGKQAGSSSGWLTTTAPCKPGETMTLTFWIHDEGDRILDSAAIIDNWQWIATKVGGPVTIK